MCSSRRRSAHPHAVRARRSPRPSGGRPCTTEGVFGEGARLRCAQENEILFPAMTALEVSRERVEGKRLVVSMNVLVPMNESATDGSERQRAIFA